MNSSTSKRFKGLIMNLAISTILIGAGSAHGEALKLMVTDHANGEPVSGAVITLLASEPVDPIAATMSQKDRAFHPRVLIVPRGSTVSFPNNDNTQHHVYSFSRAKTFNIELYANEPEAPVQFDTPGIVEIGCNIHDHMQAFIVVTDTTHLGRSNNLGEIEIALPTPAASKDEPLKIKVWHPEMSNNSDFQTRTVTGPWTTRQGLTLNISAQRAPGNGSFGDLQKRFRNL